MIDQELTKDDILQLEQFVETEFERISDQLIDKFEHNL